MGLLDLLAGAIHGGDTSAAAPAASDDNVVDGVTVTAKRKTPAPSMAPLGTATDMAQKPMAPVEPGKYAQPTPGEGANTRYNNTAQLHAVQDVENQYQPNPHGNGIGLANIIGAKGTLRNVLGTLGDAFLIQAGHQPIHGPQADREREGQAMAGFQDDPAAAANRMALTGSPGAVDDAQKMYTTYQQEQLKNAQLAANSDYRKSVIEDRASVHESQAADRQAKADDRTRALAGGILKAAAMSGDPKKYASARAAVLGRIQSNSTIDPSEFPEDPKDFINGYGMNSAQVSRNAQGEERIQQQGELGRARIGATIRGQNVSAGNVRASIAGQNARSQELYDQGLARAVNAGKTLSAGDAARWAKATHIATGKGGGSHIVLPPGLGGGAPAAPANPAGGQPPPIEHHYPSGRVAVWNGKAWVPK